MKKIIYNKIGINYNKTREADDRIAEKLLKYLPEKDNNLVADIGAGTGNYSIKIAEKNNILHALEPSRIMSGQRKHHKNITWHQGFAENIPFESNMYDGVLCILASHHFSNLKNLLSFLILNFLLILNNNGFSSE